MKFEKVHRRHPTEPQLATMIDVFSILIIFLIAGVAMDSSVLKLPADLFLPQTLSKAVSVNAPQVTIEKGILEINFIDERVDLKDLEEGGRPKNIKAIKSKLSEYLVKIKEGAPKEVKEMQLLQSINLVADKDTPYKEVFATMKFFRNNGFLNTILVGVENNGKQ